MKWFYRGRHRHNEFRTSVAELTEDLYRRLSNEPGWQIGPDGKYLVLNTTVTIPSHLDDSQQAYLVIAPKDGRVVDIPEPPCPHTNIDTHNEWEDYYSNGMFGIPASNMPIASDLVNQTFTCADCGAPMHMNAEGAIVCDTKTGLA